MARSFLPVLLMAAALSAPQAQAHEVITRMSDRQNVGMSEVLASAERSDLVLIGESHDNKSHHDMQLSVIRSLYGKHVPLAIGLEMIQTDSQRQLDDWTEGKMDERTFEMVFASNWGLVWDMYRDIFMFAREKHIPMVALNVQQAIVRKVAHGGFASLTSDERKELPEGATCDLNNPHTQFLMKAFQGVPNHMAGSKNFTYFCEAQTLRNSGMALNITRYLKKHPGTKLVGLTGIWHAIRNAIPGQLERSGSKVGCLVILPDIPELAAGNVTASEADYLIGL